MKAAILVEQRKPLVIANIEMPKKLDYGQVLVKVLFSSICGAQINEIDGVKGEDKFLPHLLGHEGGGIVMDTGPGVTTVRKGDHVVLHWRKGNGIQSATPAYMWGKKKVHAGWVTTFNEVAVVSENRVTSIPKEYDLKQASLYGCALTTAFGVIHNDAGVRTGDSVAVIGCGGVGAAILLMAKLTGAYPIIAIDINAFKLEKAREFGATTVVNSKTQGDVLIELQKTGIDVVVDTTGIKAVREMAYELTAPDGTTVLVGVPPHGEKMCIDSFPLHFDKKITGSHGGDSTPQKDIKRLIRFQQSGGFELNSMITQEFDLRDINTAIEHVRKGDRVIKCMIRVASQ